MKIKKERKTVDDKDLNNVSGGINIDSDAYGLTSAQNSLDTLSDSITLEKINEQGILEVTALKDGGKRKIESLIKDNLNKNNATVKSNNILIDKKPN